jgi:23S rRNA-/tRNA-specific pseudouridylate synthase
LDNETSGLLYFAKNPRAYQTFKEMQTSLQLYKYYLAEVYGDITHFPDKTITFPIAHHRFNHDRMVVIKDSSDLKKAK